MVEECTAPDAVFAASEIGHKALVCQDLRRWTFTKGPAKTAKILPLKCRYAAGSLPQTDPKLAIVCRMSSFQRVVSAAPTTKSRVTTKARGVADTIWNGEAEHDAGYGD